jgi:hypothetical protein
MERKKRREIAWVRQVRRSNYGAYLAAKNGGKKQWLINPEIKGGRRGEDCWILCDS